MDQVRETSYSNTILKEERMKRMISMLQPLEKRRRLQKISYLFLNSDCVLKDQIYKKGNNPPSTIPINRKSKEYTELLKIREFKSLVVQQDVKLMRKVFESLETSMDNFRQHRFKEYQYCLNQKGLQLNPRSAISQFFSSSESSTQGFVIYFSGLITQGVPCMAFQIENDVHLITIHQIIEIWRNHLKTYQYSKHLLLILESPNSGTFIDGIHRIKDRLEQYNISFVMSEKEKRVDQTVQERYQKLIYQKSQFQRRVNEMDQTPAHFTFKQEDIIQIKSYVNASEFTSALCEYLLNSPPRRLLELYEMKSEFYNNQYSPQPGFYGFIMKCYLDFGWYLDVNYRRMLNQSSINYFGIERKYLNDSMELISQRQDQMMITGNSYCGLVNNQTVNEFTQCPTSQDYQRMIKESKRQLEMLNSNNTIESDQNYKELKIKPNKYDTIERHCNGMQSQESLYLGQWLNNMQTGNGVAIFSNGDRYEGQFINGMMCGFGYLYNSNGQIYAGSFYKNKFDGKGISLEAHLLDRCFMGNFSDQEGTGYLMNLNTGNRFGVFTEKGGFTEQVEDHELFMDVGDEQDEFESQTDTSFYGTAYKENRKDKVSEEDEEKIKQYQEKQKEVSEKAKEIINQMIYGQLGENSENNSNQATNETTDITQLPYYDDLKTNLNYLNPDLESEKIQAEDVELLISHAVCSQKMDEQEIIEKKEKTDTACEDIIKAFENFELDQEPVKEKKVESENQEKKDESENKDNPSNQEMPEKVEMTEEQKEQQKEEQRKRSKLIPLVAMKKFYSTQNINVFISDEKVEHKSAEQQQAEKYKQSLLSIGQTQNTTYQKIKIPDDYTTTFTDILEEEKKKNFIEDFKKNVALAHNCKPEDVVILGIDKGSIDIKYVLKEAPASSQQQAGQALQDIYKSTLQMHSLLEHATLTADNCDERFNMEWEKKQITFRGQINFKNLGPKSQHYILPVGWKGYGLNVSKYGESKDWLGLGDRNKSWIVLYHGTNLNGLTGITKEEFKAGKRHKYGNDQCRIKGTQIPDKSGVYLSDEVEEAARYSTPFPLGGKMYKIVFQCRVNPAKVYSPIQFDKYYIVTDTPGSNIRPYRILLKKVTGEELKQYQIDLQKIQVDSDQINEKIKYVKQVRKENKLDPEYDLDDNNPVVRYKAVD